MNYFKTPTEITLIITGTLLLLLLLGRIVMSFRFRKQVAALYANIENVSAKMYHSGQLNGLPEPVQRYFRYALKDGQPYINSVRLKHNGLFKTDLKKDFINIKGEQYFSVQPPQFIWKGTTSMFTARDSFIAGKGNLKVSLFNIITVVNGKGSTLDEGELQRWLAESVWFPTNLLPSEYVKWSAIDVDTAKLSFHYNAVAFDFIVRFNAIGEITEIQGERFMTTDKKEKWVCKMANYKEVNNVKIPFSDQAIWRLEDGDHCYAKFEVQTIEYDVSKR